MSEKLIPYAFVELNENDEYEVKGKFDFKATPAIMSMDKKNVITEVSFLWSPDVPQKWNDDNNGKFDDNLREMLGEKIKQDFMEIL